MRGDPKGAPRPGPGFALTGLVAMAGLVFAHVATATTGTPPARPYVPPPGPHTGPAPAPNMPRERGGIGSAFATAAILVGRTGYNDRELVLRVDDGGAGNRPSDGPDSSCGREVRVVVVADRPDAVVLEARAYEVLPPRSLLPWQRVQVECLAIYAPAHAVARLPTPLAGRPVIDANPHPPAVLPDGPASTRRTTPDGAVVPITDGATLQLPTWLPEGYALRWEDPPASWTFRRTDPGSPWITLAQGRSAREAAGRVNPPGPRVWEKDGQWFVLTCGTYSLNGRPEIPCPSDAELQRIADSLRPIALR